MQCLVSYTICNELVFLSHQLITLIASLYLQHLNISVADGKENFTDYCYQLLSYGVGRRHDVSATSSLLISYHYLNGAIFVFRGKYFIGRKVFGDWDIRVEQVNAYLMTPCLCFLLFGCQYGG